MKLKYTIVLVFLYTCNLLAGNPTFTDNTFINTIVKTDFSGAEVIVDSPTIAAEDTGMLGNVLDDEDGTLDSVLSYFILIFLSVLVIILIDNRNLERRYKKLVADFKTKDPTI